MTDLTEFGGGLVRRHELTAFGYQDETLRPVTVVQVVEWVVS